MNYFTLGNFNFQKYIHGKELKNVIEKAANSILVASVGSLNG